MQSPIYPFPRLVETYIPRLQSQMSGTAALLELRSYPQSHVLIQELSGAWVVEPDPGVRDGKSLGATRLRYEISVAPKWAIPASLVSALVRAGLPANICAVAERAEQVRPAIVTFG